MADVLHPNFRHKLRYTPMRDVVRGRATGRLYWRGRVRASELPTSAQDLIIGVVRRTRLWALEKVDVADELIAHFADAIAAGKSAEAAIRSFGDERRAAKLIRRAKRRSRPPVWHALHAFGWLLAGLVIVYAVLTVRFFLGKPTVKVDYLAILNRDALNTPEDQRAWPIYRRAALALSGNSDARKDVRNNLLHYAPGQRRWHETVAWLRANRAVVDGVVRGSQMPALGFVLGPDGSAHDPELWPNSATTRPLPADDPVADSMIALPIPYFGELKTLSMVLAADAKLALDERDAARATRDIDAMIRMAEQVHRDGQYLIGDLVALGIRNEALHCIELALTRHASVLSEEELRRLAHSISPPSVASDLIGLAGERMAVHDAIQRIFTDNGAGDGRITPAASRFLNASDVLGWAGQSQERSFWSLPFAGPALLTASRAQSQREYDRILDLFDRELHMPLHDVGESTAVREFWRLTHTPAQRLRWTVLKAFVPSINSAQATAERYLGRRDATEIAIALELYRRQNGNHPQYLEPLAPSLLPRVPVDRITGDALHYRLVNGKPQIYSVGADRDDDGGRPPLNRMGRAEPWTAAQWGVDPAKAPDGDWILYPESVSDTYDD